MPPNNVREVLREWEGCKVREAPHGENMMLYLMPTQEPEPSHDYTLALVKEYKWGRTGESVTHWLRFSDGSGEFLIAVAERLSQTFGPMLPMDDTVSVVIVSPGTTIGAAWVNS